MPCLSVAESLMAKGNQIPILFRELSQVESQVSAAKAWRDQAAKIFLKKRSQFTLLEVKKCFYLYFGLVFCLEFFSS